MQKNVLAIDALGDVVSAAWVIDNVLYYHAIKRAKHADVIGECLRNLLESHRATLADVQLMVVNVGPGSFTGLRVGMASAQAIAWAHKLPMWSVSNLLGCAYRAHWSACLGVVDSGCLLDEALLTSPNWAACDYHVALDARMQEVYSGVFHAAGDPWLNAIVPERLLAKAVLTKSSDTGEVVGDGWSDSADNYALNWACVMAMVAYYRFEHLDVVSADAIRAVYLRDRVVGN